MLQFLCQICYLNKRIAFLSVILLKFSCFDRSHPLFHFKFDYKKEIIIFLFYSSPTLIIFKEKKLSTLKHVNSNKQKIIPF